jgi:hypothetical protein
VIPAVMSPGQHPVHAHRQGPDVVGLAGRQPPRRLPGAILGHRALVWDSGGQYAMVRAIPIAADRSGVQWCGHPEVGDPEAGRRSAARSSA